MSNIRNKWKSEDILRLIGLIEENQCLWNVYSTEYRDRNKREDTLRAIAEELQVSVDEVKKKIHCLRTQYTSERSKMKKYKSRDGSTVRYNTKWEFYQPLKFMFQHNLKTETIDCMDTTVQADYFYDTEVDKKPCKEYDADANVDYEYCDIRDEVVSLSSSSSLCSKQSYNSQSTSLFKTKKRKRMNRGTGTDHRNQADINRCIDILNSSEKLKDKYIIFGENVASELRQLKDVEEIQFKLKSTILQAILEANTAAHIERKRKKML